MMDYQKVNVTKEMALQVLETNHSNRHLRQSRVNYFVDLLTRGEFMCTHQGVAISSDRRLLDGQHRLWAIAISGISADIMVAINVDEATFITMDRTLVRSISDVLGTDVRVTDVASFIARFYTGSTPAPDQIKKLLDVIGGTIMKLMEASPGVRARVSASPIRAGIVVRMMDIPDNADRLCGIYAHFKSRDYENLPKSVQSLLRQIDENGVLSRNKDDLFFRTYRAFNVSNFSSTRILIKDADFIREEIRAILSRSIPIEVLTAAKTKKIIRKKTKQIEVRA